MFDELEPFGEERADIRAAQVVQALWNIHRDPKRNPNGWPLTDFILAFGDSPSMRVVQSVETQTLLIETWIEGHNAALAAKGAR